MLPPPDPPEGAAEVLADLYEELRRAAHRLMHGETPGVSIEATDLMHEAVARVLRDSSCRARTDPAYLFRAVLIAMERVLVDRARARNALKRGGGWERTPLDDIIEDFERRDLDLEAVQAAIEELAEWDETQAQIIRMRYWLGMSVGEIAGSLGLPASKVDAQVRLAKARIRGRLKGAGGVP